MSEKNEYAENLRRVLADFPEDQHHLDAAAAEIERLAARVRELESDAERYRYLRSRNWSQGGMVVVAQADSVKLGHETLTHERLDDAIDLALAPKGSDS